MSVDVVVPRNNHNNKSKLLLYSSLFVSGGFLLYRGTKLFFKNEITLFFNETITLSPIGPQTNNNNDNIVSVEGNISFEAMLMKSYRFSLKLNTPFQNNNNNNLNKRVFSNSNPSRNFSPRENSDYDNHFERINSGNYILDSNNNSNNNNNNSNNNTSLILSERKSSNNNNNNINNEKNINKMIDLFEFYGNQTFNFTPACISVDHLLQYKVLNFNNNKKNENLENGNKIFVKNCYFQSDAYSAKAQKLSFEVLIQKPSENVENYENKNKNNTIKIMISLPNAACHIVSIEHDKVGSIDIQNNNNFNHIYKNNNFYYPESPLLYQQEETYENELKKLNSNQNNNSKVIWHIGNFNLNHFSALQKIQNSTIDYHNNINPIIESPINLKFSVIFVNPLLNENNNNEESDSDDENNNNNENSKNNNSNKTKKREERALKKKYAHLPSSERKKILQNINQNNKIPKVEILYHGEGLVTDTRVKRLSILSEKENFSFNMKSVFDKYILFYWNKIILNNALVDLKLSRFALYNCWIRREVLVTEI